ncbi:MAG: polymerase beta domain protein region protein [Candidatus Amesbacteria bacterium GW2011_GWA1_46_35]|uniref:Polymerase beta domain protein region protein n=1 Tax=Candidatus Amesbacteria bacterium GW2011_GWC2_45_19 TaxID=1618366 RepID=A0A0G1PBC4_9BACT|nr:MAG: polymerase beta domain protein region protein [Candidatus Amesbacteria bacterium GW2011_GWC2_45_19]KKU37817.1 MAG: polymerase beta domain protein region protein [Candidatus Amesbacteria bacterium GW2011_GWA1_46_35]KKU69357.1 MAG: polymerase beta domain protein region protein [Microgenomates group bacterium GW2011_GWC1_47_20]
MLTEEQKRKIREYVKDKPVEVVYLFGSQAAGNARPGSDYDFGVLYQKQLNSHQKFEMDLELVTFFQEILKKNKVDVVDLDKAYLRFKYEAIKARKEIFVANNQIRDDFEYEVLRDYLDEMYYMKQTTRDYLKVFSQI